VGAPQGGPIKELRAGDIVWFEPAERHWHGATTHDLYVGSSIGISDEDSKITQQQDEAP
jgi:quercetin dioxygenase-like cupin family protein